MARTILCLAIVASQLAVGQVASSRPPDEVASSPIPPLKEQAPRRVTQGFRATPQERGVFLPIPPTGPIRSFGAEAQPQPQATAPQQRGYVIPNTEAYGAERLEIWNSPEMLEARAYVVEYSRRAARTSPAEGQQFLTRLSQLSPSEMRSWLERYQARRSNLAIQRAVEELARQLMLEQAINRQEAMRQAYANINYLRSQAAAAMQERHVGQQQLSQQLGAARMMQREGASSPLNHQRPDEDALDFVFDPSSPRGYKRKVAAAMSLPGDLPPSDPRNFIRGEEGVDFGEWATTRGAEPPVAGVSRSTPAAPIAPPVAEAAPSE